MAIPQKLKEIIQKAAVDYNNNDRGGKIINKGDYGVSYGMVPKELVSEYLKATQANQKEYAAELKHEIEMLTIIHSYDPESDSYGIGFQLGSVIKLIQDEDNCG